MPNTAACDPDQGEFDILEMVDGNGVGYSTYHWQDDWPAKNCTFPVGHQEVTNNIILPATWGTAFHEYAVEIAQDHVAFVYDGVTVLNRSISGPAPAPLLWPLPFLSMAKYSNRGTKQLAQGPK
jgi:hypothetical protein